MKRKKRKFVVRPWSLGVCPTADEFRKAWANRRKSQKDFIALLSVLGELTCFTDCSLKHLGGFGNIAGRQGGLKTWLQREAPDLMGKYKSISRHATLATRLKKAFDYYPPAPLSLLHPELPKPKRVIPYIVHYANTLREQHFQTVEPTYVAFKTLVDHRLKTHRPKHKWGPALPQAEWKAAEEQWYRICVVPQARRQLQADFDWYARDFNIWEDYRYTTCERSDL